MSRTEGPLRALAAVQRHYAELPLPAELAALERIDSASHYVHRITSVWAPVIRSHRREALTRDLLQILSQWEDSGDAAILAEPAPAARPSDEHRRLHRHPARARPLAASIGVI
jgi:hypothetical protein